MKIEQIIDSLEVIKAKGLKLWLWDLETLVRLYDATWVLQIESDSQYIEYKNEIDNKKAITFETYKNEETEVIDAKGNAKMKTKYSDEVIRRMLIQDYQEQDVKLSAMRTVTKMTEHKKDVIEQYINLIKIIIR